MAGSTTNISIRMDSDLKAQADRLFGELGMNLTTAFNIFVRQSLREGRIPFDISLNQRNSCRYAGSRKDCERPGSERVYRSEQTVRRPESMRNAKYTVKPTTQYLKG